MAAALTLTPASGSITAVTSVVRVDVTGAPENQPPSDSGDEFRYYIKASLTGQDDLISHTFAPSNDGKHSWNGLVFPIDGAWTVDLCDAADDSVEATAAVTVNA